MSSEIEEGDVLTGRCPDADVARRRNTSVLALQQADALVALGDGGDDTCGLIGGAVINDDDLGVDARLPLGRRKSVRNETCAVVDGHDDADTGGAHAGNSSMKRRALSAISLLFSESSIRNTGSCRVNHAANMKPDARAPGICAHIDGANC